MEDLSAITIFNVVPFMDSAQLSQEEATTFYDELNHHIFELVSSSDVNEKKGGILAIGKLAPCHVPSDGSMGALAPCYLQFGPQGPTESMFLLLLSSLPQFTFLLPELEGSRKVHCV